MKVLACPGCGSTGLCGVACSAPNTVERPNPKQWMTPSDQSSIKQGYRRWYASRWMTQDFEANGLPKLGVALELVNDQTGEIRRNAVGINLSEQLHKGEGIRMAQRLLELWAEEHCTLHERIDMPWRRPPEIGYAGLAGVDRVKAIISGG